MPDPAPTVLILGGITTLARPLALYLLNSSPTPSVIRPNCGPFHHFSPPSTYLDRPFRELLQTDQLEYQQINLSNVARHAELLTHETKGFDVVYDLTGEMGFDKSEIVSLAWAS